MKKIQAQEAPTEEQRAFAQAPPVSEPTPKLESRPSMVAPSDSILSGASAGRQMEAEDVDDESTTSNLDAEIKTTSKNGSLAINKSQLEANQSLDFAQAVPKKTQNRSAKNKTKAGSRDVKKRFELARTLFQQGKCEQSVRVASAALQIDPIHSMAADALFDQAACLIKLGRFEEAKAAYRTIQKNFPHLRNQAKKGLNRIPN